MEVDSEKFIEDALNGIVLIDHYDVYKDGAFSYCSKESVAGSPNTRFGANPLIFYNDGTCKNCYCNINNQEQPYLYTTFYWSINKDNNTITLNCKVDGLKQPTGTLTITKYSNNNFTLSGTLPDSSDDGYSYKLYGYIGTSDERTMYEKRHFDENLYLTE